jgi:membrane-associated protease RseP (regulator of RpoE activity)
MTNRGFKLAVAILSVALIGAVIVGGVALAQTPTPQAANSGAWIGVSLADLDAQMAKRLGVEPTTGVIVVSVVPGGPAGQAGVQAKDLITALDGKPITKSGEVVAGVKAKSVGQVVELTVNRAGNAMTFKITTAQAATPQGAKGQGGPGLPGQRFGFALPFGGFGGVGQLQGFGSFLGSQFKFLDKDNKPVTVRTIPGTVASSSKDSITIKPNDPGESSGPFAITGDTKAMVRGKNGVESLAAGDKVIITTSDGKTALSVSLVADPPTINGNGNGNGNRNGQWGNRQFSPPSGPKQTPAPKGGA